MGDSPQPNGGEHGAEAMGMRFLLIPSYGQEDLETRIADMGGQVLSPLDFMACTHVCAEGDLLEGLEDAIRRQGKEPVGQDWVNERFDRRSSMLVIDAEPTAPCQGDDGVTEVASTRKRSRSVLGSESSSSSNLGRSVSSREDSFVDDDDEEEAIYHRHHGLFLCKHDLSPRISLHEYAAQTQHRLRVAVPTPGGSLSGHVTVSTESEVKLIVKKAYVLLRDLHEAGLTLAGRFSSRNFLIGEALFTKNIVFGHLPSGALKKCNPDDKDVDLVRFNRMIRRELFVQHIVPHDLNVWLALMSERGFVELLPDHVSLKEAYQNVSTLMSLCSEFVEMEHEDADKYRCIIDELSEYSDWKQRVDSSEGNSYLQEILWHIDPATNKAEYYEDDLRGLLRLVMDYCERADTWSTVSLVVGQDFPNLLSDLQKKMYTAGYYVPSPRWG